MKKLLLLLITLFLFLYTSFAFAQIYYVSNDGSSSGDGSLTNPFDKISVAYDAAVPNGQNEVIKLLPGNYHEANTLIFDNENITISGYGDQSVINNNIIVKSNISFADVYIQGSLSNENYASVNFNNVKCDDSNINIESISGIWRDSKNRVHINYLIDPKDGIEAVNLDSMTNYVANAGFATEKYVDNKQITTINIADNAINLNKLATTSIDTRYLKKSGDTMTGNLAMDNAIIHGKNAVYGMADTLTFKGGNSFYCYGGKIKLPGADSNIMKGGNVEIEGGYSMMGIAGNVYIKSGGGPFPGSVNISSGQKIAGGGSGNVIIHDVITPVSSKDAANKVYVDSQINFVTNNVDDNYISKSGGTMTGKLTVGSYTYSSLFDIKGRIGKISMYPGQSDGYAYFEVGNKDWTGNINGLKITGYSSSPLANLYLNAKTTRIIGNVNISGTLTVQNINITGSSHWNIGSASQRADIVIKNPNTEIRSENGDVILNAASDKIVMKSKVKLSSDQFGSATIATDTSMVHVTGKNVSGSAVILLTPRGEVSGAPYAQINSDGTFDIILSDIVSVPTVINYLILE